MSTDIKRFKTITTAELKELPDPEWLIDGIIPEHGTSQVYGFEGSHKSFLTIDMAYCIASGIDWHGHKVKRGRVLYIAAEGGPPLKQRVLAWEQHHGIENADVTWLMGEELMLDAAGEKDALAAVDEWRDEDYAFIVFDTLRTSSRGNEQSPEVMGAITRSMRTLQRELNTTVMIVHHPPKSSDKTYGGAAGMGSNIGTNIRVSYDEKATTVFECVKQKDAECFDTLAFEHKKVGPSLVMVAEGSGDAEPRGSKHDETILRLIQAYSQGVSRAEFRDMCVRSGVPRSSAYGRFTALLNQRKLTQDQTGKLYPIGAA